MTVMTLDYPLAGLYVCHHCGNHEYMNLYHVTLEDFVDTLPPPTKSVPAATPKSSTTR
jgi:hypothetical protein